MDGGRKERHHRNGRRVAEVGRAAHDDRLGAAPAVPQHPGKVLAVVAHDVLERHRPTVGCVRDAVGNASRKDDEVARDGVDGLARRDLDDARPSLDHVKLRRRTREPDAPWRRQVAAADELAPRLEKAQNVGQDIDAVGVTNEHARANVNAAAALAIA
jgi:hypothetical protein